MTTENDEKALRDELDARKDSGHELDGFEKVTGRAARAPRAVFSLRVAPSELDELIAAAAAVNQNVSEFVRQAALTQAREIASPGSGLAERARALQEAQEKARELEEALRVAAG